MDEIITDTEGSLETQVSPDIMAALEEDTKTVLVTGGAGFIGSNYCRYVLEHHPSYRVIVLDALTYAGNLSTLAPIQHHPDWGSRFRFYPGKIQDETVVNGILKAEKVNYILNFAADSHNDRSILD